MTPQQRAIESAPTSDPQPITPDLPGILSVAITASQSLRHARSADAPEALAEFDDFLDRRYPNGSAEKQQKELLELRMWRLRWLVRLEIATGGASIFIRSAWGAAGVVTVAHLLGA